MNQEKIKQKLIKLREDSYNFEGSYEENYVLFMDILDEIIAEIEESNIKKHKI